MSERKRGWFRDQSGQAVLLGTFAIMTLAISMMAGIRYIGPKYTLNQTVSTTGSINNVTAALDAYVQNNGGNLPCPDLDGSGYAADDPAGGHVLTKTATVCGSGSATGTTAVPATTYAVWGLIPWRSLHLTQQQSLDQFGHVLTYAVGTTSTPNPSYPGAASVNYGSCPATGLLTAPSTLTIVDQSANYTYQYLADNLGAVDPYATASTANLGGSTCTPPESLTTQQSQTAAPATNPYPYLLLSQGANGRGAYLPTVFGTSTVNFPAPTQLAIPGLALEAFNCPRSMVDNSLTPSGNACDTSLNNSAGANNFVLGPPTPKNTDNFPADNTFDDLVTLGSFNGTTCQDEAPYVLTNGYSYASGANTGTLNVVVYAPAGCAANLTVTFHLQNATDAAYMGACPYWGTDNSQETLSPVAGTSPTGCTAGTNLNPSYTAAIPASAFTNGSVSLDFVITTAKNTGATCTTPTSISGCPFFTVDASTTTEKVTGIPEYFIYKSPTNTGNSFGQTTFIGTNGNGSTTFSKAFVNESGSSSAVLIDGTPNSSDTSASMLSNSQACTWGAVAMPWTTQMLRTYVEFTTNGYATQQLDGFTFTFLPNLGSTSTSWLSSTVCGSSPTGGTTEGSYIGFENIVGPATTAAKATAVLGHLSGTTCLSGFNALDETGCIYQITLGTSGQGYFSPPTVTIAAPSSSTGTTSTAYATLSPAGGKVTGVTVTAGGTGYTSTPTVVFTGGGGSGASATVTMTSSSSTRQHSTSTKCSTRKTCSVYSVTVPTGDGGTGYTSAPTVTFSGGGGSGAAATATVSAATGLAGITITNVGSKYTAIPAVTIASSSVVTPRLAVEFRSYDQQNADPPDGFPTQLVRHNPAGEDMAVDVVDTSGPRVIFTGGGAGTGAYGYATVGSLSGTTCTETAPTTATVGCIYSITVTAGGSSYGSAPTVTVVDGAGSGATAKAVMSGTSVSSVTMLTSGAGYLLQHDDTFHSSTSTSGGFLSNQPWMTASSTDTTTTGTTGTGASCDTPGSGRTNGAATGGAKGACSYSSTTNIVTSNGPVSYSQGSPASTVYYHRMRIEAARYCNSTCSSCGNAGTAADHYMLIRGYLDCPATFGNGVACSDLSSPALMTSASAPGTTFAPGSTVPSTASTINYCMADPGYTTQLGISAYDSTVFGITAGSGSVNGGTMFTNGYFGTFSP